MSCSRDPSGAPSGSPRPRLPTSPAGPDRPTRYVPPTSCSHLLNAGLPRRGVGILARPPPGRWPGRLLRQESRISYALPDHRRKEEGERTEEERVHVALCLSFLLPPEID